jgi:2-octaprenyl-6-methoxyphenol hydroxylase
MGRDCDVLIVGGGLNGPALALALASAGISSIVLDAGDRAPREADDFDGRAYALALTSRRMLGALGLWAGLAGEAQPINDIKISDGRPGAGAARGFLHFDHREIDEGPMGHILEDRFLRRALMAAVDAEPLVEARYRAEVTGQAAGPAGASVTLADGSELRAGLDEQRIESRLHDQEHEYRDQPAEQRRQAALHDREPDDAAAAKAGQPQHAEFTPFPVHVRPHTAAE